MEITNPESVNPLAWISDKDRTNLYPKFYVANCSESRGVRVRPSFSQPPADSSLYLDGEPLYKKDYRSFQGSYVEIFAHDGKRFYWSSVRAWTSLIVCGRRNVIETSPLDGAAVGDAVWTIDGKLYKPYFTCSVM
jgi:hypothetical protein